MQRIWNDNDWSLNDKHNLLRTSLHLHVYLLGYDPVLSEQSARNFGIEPTSLDELLEKADFITIHTPLTKDTQYLLNAQTLLKCKKGVRIVNCARGGIVDEAALLDAVKSGHVAGASLDVVSLV